VYAGIVHGAVDEPKEDVCPDDGGDNESGDDDDPHNADVSTSNWTDDEIMKVFEAAETILPCDLDASTDLLSSFDTGTFVNSNGKLEFVGLIKHNGKKRKMPEAVKTALVDLLPHRKGCRHVCLVNGYTNEKHTLMKMITTYTTKDIYLSGDHFLPTLNTACDT